MNKREYERNPLWGSRYLERYFDGQKTWFLREMDVNEEEKEGEDTEHGYVEVRRK